MLTSMYLKRKIGIIYCATFYEAVQRIIGHQINGMNWLTYQQGSLLLRYNYDAQPRCEIGLNQENII